MSDLLVSNEIGNRRAVLEELEREDRATYVFRVTGRQQQRTLLPSMRWPFDETFEIVGEHPAEALGKLVGEIEWGILDSDERFEIEFLGEKDAPVYDGRSPATLGEERGVFTQKGDES